MGYSDAYHIDDDCPPCDGLFRREQELLEGWALYWLEGLTRRVDISRCEYHQETGRVVEFGGAIVSTAHFRRGFVERVEMATDDFLAHAKVMFSRHPITEVVLVDREPMPNSGGRSWWDLSRVAYRVHPASNVPSAIFSRLTSGESVNQNLSRNYPAMAATLADLSRACVRHGRAEAGLPQLEEGSHDKVSP